jgi:PBP1b-binding outer membrane lipoprotein LpoB
MISSHLRRFVLLAAAVVAAGCGVKTVQTNYVNPDTYGTVEGTGIEARDVRAVTSQMATELLSSAAIQKFNGVPRVAVLPVQNRSRFLVDQEIFTTLITDMLIQNASGKLAILNRDIAREIQKEREMKRSGQVDSGAQKALAGADFFLDGEIQSLSASNAAAQSDYVVIRFQLTDAESGIVVWSNSFQMKKEGSWGVMYQ